MKYVQYICVLAVVFCVECKPKSTQNKEEQIEFTYTPSPPVNGVLKGVVELGTTGFNYFVIEIDSSKNWSVKHHAYGKSLIAEGMTNTDEIDSKLNMFLKEVADLGVQQEHINFVVSSGAIKEEGTQLIVEELKKKSHKVKVVNSREEAVYILKSVLPKKYSKESFVVDIGSGNTKISYFKDENISALETHGSKYHQKGVEDEIVYKDVKEMVSKVPVQNRKYCFLLGGIPAVLAKSMRKADERYTKLHTDGDKFDDLVAAKGRKVKSGVNIYKAILAGTNCKTVIFDWESNFTIGYLLEKEDK